MYKILIALIIGLTIGGMWVQYRFTGNIWSNEVRQIGSIESPGIKTNYIRIAKSDFRLLQETPEEWYFLER